MGMHDKNYNRHMFSGNHVQGRVEDYCEAMKSNAIAARGENLWLWLDGNHQQKNGSS